MKRSSSNKPKSIISVFSVPFSFGGRKVRADNKRGIINVCFIVINMECMCNISCNKQLLTQQPEFTTIYLCYICIIGHHFKSIHRTCICRTIFSWEHLSVTLQSKMRSSTFIIWNMIVKIISIIWNMIIKIISIIWNMIVKIIYIIWNMIVNIINKVLLFDLYEMAP